MLFRSLLDGDDINSVMREYLSLLITRTLDDVRDRIV